MLEQLKQKLSSLRLEKFTSAPVMGIAAVIITGLIVFSLWRSNQGYTALFGSQQQIPVSQVVEVLGGESIPYRIHPDGGEILVRESDLPKARMALAGKGITALSPSGYELMDKEEMLGTSQFIQNVRYKRSLEGELAQSIMSLNAVESARVHLGLTESSSFVLSNRPASSASVVVRLRYGQQLNAEQIASIIQMVAGSIPGMKPDNVRVVDQQGTLLSDEIQLDDEGGYSSKKGTELAKRLESETARSIANLLSSVVGENNYRISVSTKLDLSNVDETQERYSGYPRVSNETVNQENIPESAALGIPGSLSNRPPNTQQNQNAQNPNAQNPNAQNPNAQNPNGPQQPGAAPGTAAAAQNSNMSTRSQSQRQYAYDRDIRHIRHPSYRVEKMSVAVVLNDKAPLLQGWKPEQFEQLNKLLSDAAGVDSKRGDSLTLSQMAFTPEQSIENTPLKWWEDPVITQWIVRGGVGLLALLLLLFGVNPLLRRIATNKSRSGDDTMTMEHLTDAQPGELGLSQDDKELTGLPRSTFQGEDNLPPQSSGLETKVAHLQLLAQNETERVAEVIRQWINSNERSNTKPE